MEEPPPPQISIATGIIIALLASFVQSLGLTIQRKSHLQNESAPAAARRTDWKRPLWLLGFAIFITSNILGSVFQIGALPIVVLAPLGAVSLLWNAFFARILLGDIFSRYLIIGTILIAGGAVLIAIFGVVPETTHSLEELLALYTRPSFIVWISLQFTVILIVLAFAHISEARLEKGLQDIYIALPTSPTDEDVEAAATRMPIRSVLTKFKKARRWSTPASYLAITSDTNTDNTGPASPINGLSPPSSATAPTFAKRTSSRHVSFGINNVKSLSPFNKHDGEAHYKESSVKARLPIDRIERLRLWLGIAYGCASGTLSGLCLLFAKTGVELLILTVVGKNQFKRWESWMIVLALLVCALLQLWYLNKSLRLVGPTLICPLAFCFYNLSSIFNGLMYYNQWSLLSGLQDGLLCLGIAVLLAGVWIVSIKTSEDIAEEDLSMLETEPSPSEFDGDLDEDTELLPDHDEETHGDLKSRISHLYQAFLLDQDAPLRGFSVGISASSPGFAIRPQLHQRRSTSATLPALPRLQTRRSHTLSDDPSTNFVDSPTSADDYDAAARPTPLSRTTSEGATASAHVNSGRERDLLSYRHRRKRSLAGDVYVGASNPLTEEPAIEPPLSPRKRAGSLSGLSSRSSPASRTKPLPSQQGSPLPSPGMQPSNSRSNLSQYLSWSRE